MLRMIPILIVILLVQGDGNQKPEKPEEAILEEDLNTTTTTTTVRISTRKHFNVFLHPLNEKPEEDNNWAMFGLLVVCVALTACFCAIGFYIAGNRQVAPNDNRQPPRLQENIPLDDMN